jgi:mRNA interferase MazF
VRRGDIVWAELDPVVGSEADKRRPVVVVSNDGANRAATRFGRGVVTVVPVTSNTANVRPFQVLLPARRCGMRRTGKAQAEQVRSIEFGRIQGPAGRVPPELLREIDDALRLQLAL